MKTHRMSRNTENRNARKEMAARGRASLSRGALLDPDVVLTGRRFRRANKITRVDAETLSVLVLRPDGSAFRPTVTMEVDDYTREVTGWRVTNT